jgi:predicted transcriptional regulator
VPQQQAIQALIVRGWSVRRIAHTLGINRRTVKRYAAAAPKCTTVVIIGSVPPDRPKCATEVIAGSRSLCGDLQEVIAPMPELGLRMRERYQTLLREEIGRTVASPDDIDDEIRHLFTVFSS